MLIHTNVLSLFGNFRCYDFLQSVSTVIAASKAASMILLSLAKPGATIARISDPASTGFSVIIQNAL
jgi:hypothetical protein